MESGRDTVRQAIVLIGALLAVFGAFIGSGAAGGTPIQDASGGALAADATTIAPGGPAFAIWTPIYLGLLVYAFWQSMPKQRADERQRRLGYPIAASLILNAVWILSIQAGFLALSIPVIAVLLASLVWIFFVMIRTKAKNTFELIVVDGTMGLYLGWVCVATAANVTALLVAAGFGGWGIPREVWSVVVLAIAAAVGVLLAVRSGGRLAPSASLAWGLIWIAIARLSGVLESTSTGIAAIVAAIIVVVATVALRVRRQFSHERD